MTTLNIRKVPVDIKSQFKAYCARHGYTIQEAIIALLKYSARQDIILPGIHSMHLPKVNRKCITGEYMELWKNGENEKISQTTNPPKEIIKILRKMSTIKTKSI
jgi:hypothetical protein